MDGLSDTYVDGMMRGIVAFEVPIDRLEGKAKLSQNRPVADLARVRAALAPEGDPLARAVAELMAEPDAARPERRETDRPPASGPVRGFVLTPTYRVSSGRAEVHLHAVLESGEPALLVDDRFPPYFFVRAADGDALRRAAPAARVTEHVARDVPGASRSSGSRSPCPATCRRSARGSPRPASSASRPTCASPTAT